MRNSQAEMLDNLIESIAAAIKFKIGHRPHPHLVFDGQHIIRTFNRNIPCISVRARSGNKIIKMGHIADTFFTVSAGYGN